MSSTASSSGKNVRRRKVADLNEEQKQRKRVVDRQAQQAFRERSKTQIQELEDLVATLRTDAAENEDALARENDSLRGQVNSLEQRLRQIRQLAGFRIDPSPREVQHEHPEQDYVMRETEPSVVHRIADAASSRHIVVVESLRGSTAPGQAEHHTNGPVGDRHPEDDVSLATALNSSHSAVVPEWQDTHAIGPNSSSPDRHDTPRITHLISSAFHPTAPPSDHAISLWHPSSVLEQSHKFYETVCDHSHRSCPFDHILVDYIESQRQAIAKGTPVADVIGPAQPDIVGIFRPDALLHTHSLSRILVEMMRTFAHVGRPERAAFMYKIHKTMRWHIAPSKETFEVLPTWVRPTAKQITTPHAAWIDNICWPAMRDMLVEDPEKYPFSEFSPVYSSHVTISWPYTDDDVLVDLAGTDENGLGVQTIVNPIFERHVRNLDNWTFAKDFEIIYPEMRATITSRY